MVGSRTGVSISRFLGLSLWLFAMLPMIVKIQALEYTGDCKNFNWDWYTNLYVEQNNVKYSLVTYGFTYYTGAHKVRYILDGIKTANIETCI